MAISAVAVTVQIRAASRAVSRAVGVSFADKFSGAGTVGPSRMVTGWSRPAGPSGENDAVVERQASAEDRDRHECERRRHRDSGDESRHPPHLPLKGLGSSLTLLLPKTSSMLVGADSRVWPMWPMLCAMAVCGAFVRRGNAVAW